MLTQISVIPSGLHVRQYYIIKLSLSVCLCMFVRNRLPDYAYHGDEAFTGDLMGLGLGQRLSSIFKKLILVYFWGKIAPDEKILFTSQASPLLIFVMNGD